MVEKLKDRIQNILSLNSNITELGNLKVYVSELYRLVYLKKTLHANQPDEDEEENEEEEEEQIYEYTDYQLSLFDELSAHLTNLLSLGMENKYQDIEQALRESEPYFFHLYLSPLNVPDEIIRSFISERNELYFNKRFHEIIEKSIDYYIRQGNSNLNVKLILDKLIEYFGNYGFRPSYYLRLSLLRRISARQKTLPDFLNEISDNPVFKKPFSALQNSNDERITSKKAVKILLDYMLADANYRSEVKLSETLDILLGYFELTSSELNNLTSAIVSDFFHNINVFMNALKISASWNHFVETLEPGLDQLQFGSTTLKLEMDKAKLSLPDVGSLEKGYYHIIGPAGFSNSLTFFYQRCVVIGKWEGDCFENDLSVDYENFTKKLALIFCGFKGYYIIDISLSGLLCRKVQEYEEAEIEVNQVIQLGPNMLIKVESIDSAVVNGIDGQPNQEFLVAKLLIIRQQGLEGTCLYPKMVNNGPGDFIGREVPNDRCVINEVGPTPTISRRHAEFKCKNKKIFIKNAGPNNGIFILYKKYSELVESKPSYPMKIENNTLVYSQGAKFSFTIE